jgi:cyclase
MNRKMFYEAGPLTFVRAKELRNNMTLAEMLLWRFLKAKPGGYKFRRQHPMLEYVADFFCYKLKLAIEIDGPIHDNWEVQVRDMEKQKAFKSVGIKVMRFTNNEIIHHKEMVIEKILSEITNTPFRGQGVADTRLGGRV